MGINNQNNFKNDKQVKPNLPVENNQPLVLVILKLGILLVILIIPVAFMLLDSTRPLLVNKEIDGNDNVNSGNARLTADQNNYNFKVDLPSGEADLADVSDEKINTLFNNLKK